MDVKLDMFGPEKIIEVYEPKSGMKGIIVIDNTALGPAKGGIRMTPSVDKEEVRRLARTMTLKCSLAELPFGGGKSGIIASPKQMDKKQKEKIVRAFARSTKNFLGTEYVAAPDISMAEKEMDWISSELKSKSVVTGKPKKLGGLPHELGSTGYGVMVATEVAAKHLGKKLSKMTFAVEGFGNVGQFAAKFLTEKGAKLVAVTDSKGCVYEEKGIDFEKLLKIKNETGSVINYSSKNKLCYDIVAQRVDVLVTAAIPDLINPTNVDKVCAKIVVEGSNIPMSTQMEESLYSRGILVVPDIIANAGGVISSYVEFIHGNEKQMFSLVEKKIRKNVSLVLSESKKKGISPRKVALDIAHKRIMKKCKTCRI